MEILFLGTSSMVPTKERNQQSILISLKNYDILFDCGEGTQRQLKTKKISPNRIRRIIMSHWHGDHTLGLPGLLMTMGANDFEGPLEIYGPVGSTKHIKAMIEAFMIKLPYQLVIKECASGQIFEDEDVEIECREMVHPVPCLGYSIKEKDKRRVLMSKLEKEGVPAGPHLTKLQAGIDMEYNGKKFSVDKYTSVIQGRKVAFITDTELCDSCFELASNADLLICEATFKTDLEDKAIDYKHMTSKMAAQIANQSNVKKLIITHFSQRYKSTTEMEDDAKNYFANTVAAYDFLKVKV